METTTILDVASLKDSLLAAQDAGGVCQVLKEHGFKDTPCGMITKEAIMATRNVILDILFVAEIKDKAGQVDVREEIESILFEDQLACA